MSKNKWDRFETPTAAEPVEVKAQGLTRLDLYASLAYFALMQTNMAASAVPRMAIARAKEMISAIEEELRSKDLPPVA